MFQPLRFDPCASGFAQRCDRLSAPVLFDKSSAKNTIDAEENQCAAPNRFTSASRYARLWLCHLAEGDRRPKRYALDRMFSQDAGALFIVCKRLHAVLLRSGVDLWFGFGRKQTRCRRQASTGVRQATVVCKYMSLSFLYLWSSCAPGCPGGVV